MSDLAAQALALKARYESLLAPLPPVRDEETERVVGLVASARERLRGDGDGGQMVLDLAAVTRG